MNKKLPKEAIISKEILLKLIYSEEVKYKLTNSKLEWEFKSVKSKVGNFCGFPSQNVLTLTWSKIVWTGPSYFGPDQKQF